MQVYFHRGEHHVKPTAHVSHLIIYPKAADGKGTIHVYGDDGIPIAVILLDSVDNVHIMHDQSTFEIETMSNHMEVVE